MHINYSNTKRFGKLLPILLLIMVSCKTTPPCPENPTEGNLGQNVNSYFDDYMPVLYDDVLYFSSNRNLPEEREELLESSITDETFGIATSKTPLPLNILPNSGYPSFHRDSATGDMELFFAAQTPENKANTDIYYTKFVDDKWTKPVPLGKDVNTKFYESHPCITPDGQYLIFTSDRPGGFGQTDLYITKRIGKTSWSKPENLGSPINTKAQDVSPSLAPDGGLFYASKGFGADNGYEIIRAELAEKWRWVNPRALQAPINTSFDEKGASYYNKKLYLSSTRPGGCGGFDLYSFDLCGPVLVSGKILPDKHNTPLTGEVRIVDEKGNKLPPVKIDEKGVFNVTVDPFKNYSLTYTNFCIKEFKYDKKFYAPCSDTSTVKIIMNIQLPDKQNVFTFEQYNVPFFVSGYYFPNTPQNLNELRTKFEYDILGKADSTKYIENPGEDYDGYADTVEKALNDAVDFILTRLNYLTDECTSPTQALQIKITGYSDPRPISDFARYDGESIEDPVLGFTANRGDAMTNDLLSSLRSYYTAKHLNNLLVKYDKFLTLKSRIFWKVIGKGIDDSEALPLERKRRVKIEIGIETKNKL